jgi:ABC-type uncharacterized transport system permease subunit
MIPLDQMILGVVVSFFGVGLKGFQHKNVIGDHYKLVFVTSYLMAIADVLSVGLIMKNGWMMMIPTGTGAAFGMVCAMGLHRKIVEYFKGRHGHL